MLREYRAGRHLRRGEVRPRARLLAYAQRLGLAPADAEDLVQEVYVLLLQPKDEPVLDWFSYCFGCLQKLAANTRKRERRRIRLFEQQPPGPASDPGHEDRLIARSTTDKTLDRLPLADAELLRCRFLRDMRTREIAEHIEITHAAARIRLQRALTKARAVTDV